MGFKATYRRRKSRSNSGIEETTLSGWVGVCSGKLQLVYPVVVAQMRVNSGPSVCSTTAFLNCLNLASKSYCPQYSYKTSSINAGLIVIRYPPPACFSPPLSFGIPTPCSDMPHTDFLTASLKKSCKINLQAVQLKNALNLTT